MGRTSRPLTVTLGDLEERVSSRVKSGEYASASEVMRAAIRALDEQEEAVKNWLRARIEEAMNDPRPTIPIDEAFKRLRRHAARRRPK